MSTITFKYVTNANGNEIFCETRNYNKTRDVNSQQSIFNSFLLLVILTTKKMPCHLPLPL